MELKFIYLSFDQNKRFTLEFIDNDLLQGVLFRKNKDYYISIMYCYVDLTLDVTKLPQSDKIKDISDLANAILADGVDFGDKKNTIQTIYEGESYTFKIDKLNRSIYIENIEFFYFNLEKRRLVDVYSPYKKIDGDGTKFERTNENVSLISYAIKLVDDSTYLMKTLEVADAFLDNLAKICDRKNIFMQYGTE